MNKRRDVNIRENDHRIFTAEFQREASKMLECRLTNLPPCGGRTREAELVYSGVRRKCGSSRGPAGHDIDHALRYPSFDREFGKAEHSERRFLRRLYDDGAAARERRRDLPYRDHEGEVPGNDRTNHAHRFSER
jgi:hypothetical protein